MSINYGIKTTKKEKNLPIFECIVERVHLTVGDMLRTMTFSREDWYQDLQRTLDVVAWAIQRTISPVLKYSPCHLAFNQDMIFCKAVAVDWEKVQQERNKTITASNSRENKMRIAKDYKVGDQVLIVLDADERRSQPKMDRPTRGPFEVIQVHNNGTVTIDRGNFSETINIRRIKPYHIGRR